MIRSLLRMLPSLLLLFGLVLLLSGSHLLALPVIEGSPLPVGNLAAWLCLSMFPLSVLVGIRLIRKPVSRVYRFYRQAFVIYALLGMIWGLLCYLLAGNWAFAFSDHGLFRGSDTAFKIFVSYTAITGGLSLLTFIIFLIHHSFIHLKRKQ